MSATTLFIITTSSSSSEAEESYYKLSLSELSEMRERCSTNEQKLTELIRNGEEYPEIDNSLSLTEQVINYPILGWSMFSKRINRIRLVDSVLRKPQFRDYRPSRECIFNSYRMCPLSNISVVVIGQDPYPNSAAMGMCFSTPKGHRIPASLSNIVKELYREYPDFPTPVDGWLGNWARQGVFLMNTFLTYHGRELKGSERGIWQPIINMTVAEIKIVNPNVVVMMWGRVAQEAFAEKFGTGAYELVCGHPSSRNLKNNFMGCNHFRLCNEYLTKMGRNPIDWTIKH